MTNTTAVEDTMTSIPTPHYSAYDAPVLIGEAVSLNGSERYCLFLESDNSLSRAFRFEDAPEYGWFEMPAMHGPLEPLGHRDRDGWDAQPEAWRPWGLCAF